MIEELRREWARWRTTRAAWVWPLLVTLAVAGGVLGLRWWRGLPPPAPVVTYSQFLKQLDAGAVATLTVVPGAELRGTWARAAEGAAAAGGAPHSRSTLKGYFFAGYPAPQYVKFTS